MSKTPHHEEPSNGPPKGESTDRSSTSEKAPPTTLEVAQVRVGSFLRATREALGLTQAEVAERTLNSPWKLSRAAVSAIERGQNFPGLEAMLALSNVLCIDPKELIERARLAAVVPVDIAGLSDAELESRASQYFWAGDFKRALAVYDAMVEQLARKSPAESEQVAARLATLEVRRATALKRAGALISAVACAERAIVQAAKHPAIQAEAYVVLANLQLQRGHLPLASDAAARAIELCGEGPTPTLTWALMTRGRTLYTEGKFDDARRAFLAARRQAEIHEDDRHMTHIEGNIGMCCRALGRHAEARERIERAVAIARAGKQPALEASWLVELGKLELDQGRPDEAERLGEEALNVARPLEHYLTVFRAEWLRHMVALRSRPADPDGERLSLLRGLLQQLDEHEGIEEIKEFRKALDEVGDDERGKL